MKRRQTISDQLRAIIADRGISGYALAQASGLNRSNVNGFLAGTSSLRLDSVDQLAEVLGLRLVEVGRRLGRVRPAASMSGRSSSRAELPRDTPDPIAHRDELGIFGTRDHDSAGDIATPRPAEVPVDLDRFSAERAEIE